MNNTKLSSHRAIKDALSGTIGGTFLADFYLQNKLWKTCYKNPSPRITVRHCEEYPIVKLIGKKQSGDPLYVNTPIDYVFLVQPCKGSILHKECYSIGIEIKSSWKDLQNAPEQIAKYKEQCDYYFVSVPKFLTYEANRLFRGDNKIGILNYENGEIYKMPERSAVPDENRLTMLERLTYCENQDPIRFVDICEPISSIV